MLMVGMATSVRHVRSLAIAQAEMGLKLVSVIQNSGVSAAEGFECTEVYGDTFRNVHYIASVRH